MGCGCKKKKDIARAAKAARPARTARVVVVEGEVKQVPVRPPDVVNPPLPEGDVDSIVNKLNDILKP